MAKIYITLTGTKHYYGKDFLEPGMKLRLRKDPDNPYDAEAIAVELKGLGQIGHVANSSYTVLGASLSAGRLYDRIRKKARATVVQILPQGVLCSVRREKRNKR